MSVPARVLPWNGAHPLFLGVVHLAPTPGAPAHEPGDDAWLDRARADARALCAEGRGVDGLIVENFGDTPFFRGRVPAETAAALALAVAAVRAEVGDLSVGVNCLRNDARTALAVAATTGASFVRINVHVGAMVTDQGLIEGDAAHTLRERARLCPHVELLCDVHVKHAAPLAPRPLADAAQETLERGRADALVISGAGTGLPTAVDDLRAVRERLPHARLLVGSGATVDSLAALLAVADGAIVGSALERDGRAGRPVEAERVRRMRAAFDACPRR